MSDNKGLEYEKVLNKNLQSAGAQRANFRPAGSDSNAPDAELRIRGYNHKVEVKLDTKVDFGQGSLDYDLKNKKWILGGAKTDSAVQMRKFLEAIGVPKMVNEAWGQYGPPKKFTVDAEYYSDSDVAHDYKYFKDVFVNIPKNSVEKYYNSKKTYYIQIGAGFGLYFMGEDVADLKVPRFDLNLRLRIRLKRGGSMPIYNYRFTTAIQAVQGSLNISNKNLDDKEFLKILGSISKK